MGLHSKLFRGDQALEACLVRDSAHVLLGAVGKHVQKIQIALKELDNLRIDAGEFDVKRYGRSTAAAVLAFKKKRRIINPSYQTREDNIVGKMTIAALDKEMLQRERATIITRESNRCRFDGQDPNSPDRTT
jgi:peptidoglycan hydrolase-like protein with peptidoglycan-binding domain